MNKKELKMLREKYLYYLEAQQELKNLEEETEELGKKEKVIKYLNLCDNYHDASYNVSKNKDFLDSDISELEILKKEPEVIKYEESMRELYNNDLAKVNFQNYSKEDIAFWSFQNIYPTPKSSIDIYVYRGTYKKESNNSQNFFCTSKMILMRCFQHIEKLMNQILKTPASEYILKILINLKKKISF